ncbi:MAG: hypothetical protein HZB80_08635 [Deltaproteobacteria bacterium]|nr:hypothetical protein [Deltaproteobacteria bacterium]
MQIKQYYLNHHSWAAWQGTEGIVEHLGTAINGYGEKEYLRFVDDSGKKWLIWCDIVLHNTIAAKDVAFL